MDFRLLKEETLPQAADLWDECFEKKGTPFYEWYFSHYCLKQNKIIGGFEDGQLQTMLHLNPYMLFLRGKTFQVPYIVGVATRPEARGKHLMGQLMDMTFTMLQAMKIPFVILMPIHAGIYLPYGFSYTCIRKKYELPLRELNFEGPALDGLEAVRVPTRDAESLLSPIYEKAMQPYHGYVVRDHRVWDNLLATASLESVETVIVKEGTAVLAYALYNKEGERINVQELISLNAPSRLRLLQFFKGYYGTFSTLEWLAEADDLTYLRLPDQHLAPKLAPFMMARIVDAPRMLQEMPVPASLEGKTFVLGVRDETIARNTMLVKISFREGKMVLLNTLEEPQCLMDASTLAQLVFGTWSAEELVRQGLLHVKDDAALSLLTELFPKQVNYINEYF
jgi:predicted acetyltransferase